MNNMKYIFKVGLFLLTLVMITAGCDDTRHSILFPPAVTFPTVSSTSPGNRDVDVALNQKIGATFSTAMDASSITTATFSIMNGPLIVSGSLTYSGTTAIFAPTVNFTPNTTYSATITTGTKDADGNSLENNYVWIFTTGTTTLTTAPTVTSTVPVDLATGVALNQKISATFSTPMDASTITASTFTLKQGAVSITGSLTYSGSTAVFAPSANLLQNTTYTAAITTGAKDLAGNYLTTNYVWSFTTGAATITTAPTVISTVPANGATGVVINKKISATFSTDMDPASITTSTFTLMQGTTLLSGTVSYSGKIASFRSSGNLSENTIYTAKISTGAKDLTSNAMMNNYSWNFTTGTSFSVSLLSIPAAGGTTSGGGLFNSGAGVTIAATPNSGYSFINWTENGSTISTNPVYEFSISGNRTLTANFASTPIIVLGTVATYGGFGGSAGLTNQGIFTVIHGDIGTTAVSTAITGLHDGGGNIFTETPLNVGLVTGTIMCAPPLPGTPENFAKAQQALLDAQTAFNYLKGLPGGPDPGAGELGSLVLVPGTYTAGAGTFQITNGDLTLDAQNNPNAIFVFQMAKSLTVGKAGQPSSIILVNGAQAKNIFWQVGSAATINGAGGGTMVGTIISYSGVTFSTAGVVTLTTLNGRALSLNASVTFVNTIVNIQ